MKFINPNVLNEGNQMGIIKDDEDIMKMIVRCNNCGKPTRFAETRMCSGFVGCDNKIEVNGIKIECYFDDLMPRVMKYHNSEEGTIEREKYRLGKVYRWRDGEYEIFGKI